MRVGAVILAAGASERMGQPKALLPIEGQPALLALWNRLNESNFAPVVTVTSAEIQSKLSELGFQGQIIINTEIFKGPLHSFRLGLQALPAETTAALLCPVDHPFIRLSTLQKLRETASESKVVIPCCQGRRGHPTLFGCELWPLIFSLPLEEGARGVLRRRPECVTVLEVNDPGVVQNLNTAADIENAKMTLSSDNHE
jgi:molybdenum cofactor cytidylyltransferase